MIGRKMHRLFHFTCFVFWARGRFTPQLTKRVVGLTGLLVYKVYRLVDGQIRIDEEQLAERKSKPTVSQYRLTTHLGAAF